MIRRALLPAVAAALALAPGTMLAQTYQFSLDTPEAVSVVGPSFTVTLLSTNSPPSPSTANACFYLSDATTATSTPLPIQTSVSNSNITFTVPASYLDASPPADFTNTGTISAKVYYQGATDTNCDGKAVAAYTSTATITVNAPQVLYTSTNNLPQTNPAAAAAKPVNFIIMGAFFAPATQVQFTGLSSGTVTATSKYLSPESLVVTAPAIPSGSTFGGVQVATVGPQGSYPAMDGADLGFYSLRQSQLSNLAVSPPSPTAGATTTFSGVSSDTGADSQQFGGVPTGPITFTPQSAGSPVTGTLTANPLSLSFAMNSGETDANTSTQLLSVIGDFNGDGIPDALVEENLGGIYYLTVYPGGYPLGTFSGQQEATELPQACTLQSIAVGDINGDGAADLVLLCYDTATAMNDYDIFLANGDGTFTFTGTVDSGSANGLALGDFYHHGKLDLVAIGPNSGATESQVNVYEGNGDGTFGAANTRYFTDKLIGLVYPPILTADMNGDGYPDLVISGQGEEIDVLISNGDGTFGVESTAYSPNYSYPVAGGLAAFGIAVGDVNNDNLPDIVFTEGIMPMVSPIRPPPFGKNVGRSRARQNYESAWPARRTGAGSALPIGGDNPAAMPLLSGKNNWTAAKAKPAVSPRDGNNTIQVLLNTTSAGTVSFSAPVSSSAPGLADDPIAIANFDGDCCNDIAVSNGTEYMVYSGDGKGDFAASDTGLTAPLPANTDGVLAVLGTDLDGDGVADLIYSAAVSSSGMGNDTYSFAGGLTTGSASVSAVGNPDLPTGTYTVDVSSNGSTVYTGATGTISSLMVAANATTPSLVLSVPAPAYGQQETLTATITQATTAASLPSGTATFSIGTTTLGTATVTNGTAVLSGVDLPAGTYNITTTYSGDSFNAAGNANTSVTVTPALLTVTANNLSMQQGAAVPTLTYGITGFQYSDNQSNATTGAPSLNTTATSSSAPGNYPITVTQGTLAATNYTFSFVNGTLTVTDATLAITTSSLPVGMVNTAYSTTLSASGGMAPYMWSVTAGKLPAGVQLDAAAGTISGTPTAAGTAGFTIQVSDSESMPMTASVALVLGIDAPQTVLDAVCAAGGTCPGISQSGLIQASDGYYYGTTSAPEGYSGTIFKVDSTGTLTTLYTFCSTDEPPCPGGSAPVGGVIQGNDGNFYGVTLSGGANNDGTVYQLTPAGVLTTLYSFAGGADGSSPAFSLVQGSDGLLYGTTGGNNQNAGGVFKITTAGVLTPLYTFCSLDNCPDGYSPNGPLVQGSDGNFYGTTAYGGSIKAICLNNDDASPGCGTVFKVTPTGTLTTLYNFCALAACADGFVPSGALIQASDGNFYGTTYLGGTHGISNGSAFRLTPGGKLTTIYSFCALANCADGVNPSFGVLQASDGNLYGTTSFDSAGGEFTGTAFQISSSGAFTSLYNFCTLANCSDGADPTTLLQGSDGNFYGTTQTGGSAVFNDGTIFQLAPATLAAPVQVTLSSSSVAAGSPVTLAFKVLNAYSTSLQQCYAFIQNGATPANAGNWTGLETGALAGGVYTGSTSITPTAAGTYTYALTCGGVESGFSAPLTVMAVTPSISSITPSMVVAGSPATPITVSGTGFSANDSVVIVPNEVPTTFNSANGTLSASIPVGVLKYPGEIYIEVTDNSTNLTSSAVGFNISTIPTTTTLRFSSTTPTYGAPISLTATITPQNQDGASTASVSFYDGENLLGTVASSGFSATLTGVDLGAGAHTLYATFAGDNLYQASTGVNGLSVAKAALTVTANNLSRVQGQANPTLTYSMTGFQYADNQANSTTGAPALSTTATQSSPVGTYPITVTQGTLAAANYTFSFVNGVLTVTAASAPTISAITPITTPAGSAATPITVTGTNFDANDYVLVNGHAITNTTFNSANGTLSATIPASYLTVPNDLIISVMDSVTGQSNDSAPTFYVTSTTTTTLTSSSTSPVYGTPISLTATATPATTGGITPNYSITFYDGTTVLGTLTGSGFSATLTGLQLSAGTHSLSATFTDTEIPVNYISSTGKDSLAVAKAALTATANNLSKQQGAANPTLTYALTGFQYSDTQANATTGAPSLSTTATTASPAGTYPISITQGTLAAANYAFSFANGVLTVTPTNPNFTLTSLSPDTTNIGAAKITITLSGTGFTKLDQAQVNGVSIQTGLVNSTTLKAVIPASDLATAGTLEISVYDPDGQVSTNSLPFTVTVPPVDIVFSGPSSAPSATQPDLTFTLTNPYPVELTATLTLTFSGANGADDPAIEFANGSRTFAFNIAANSTATPAIQLQTGTDAGAVTVTLAVAITSTGQDVTPSGLTPVSITIPKEAPVITSMTLTRSGDTITVNIMGYANTRDMASADFTFTGAGGASIDDPDVTVPAATLFGGWYSSAQSQAFGSEFLYTQAFTLNTDNSAVGQVMVTLTNSTGISGSATAQ